MGVPPRPSELFADAKSPLELATKWESYRAALTKAFRRPVPPPHSPAADLHRALQRAELNKSVSAETVESLQQQMSMITKDITVAGPGSTGGLQAFDLQAPAIELAPRMTPLRNKISRVRGVGTSHRYKRITGWSNSSTGGVADLWAGIDETTTNSMGGQTLRRGPVIELAGDQANVPYMTFGESNSVTWESEFAGQGYQDIRQLSTTSLLYSSMVFEEKAIIESRGTVSPFSGGLGAPTGVAVTCAAPGTGQSATTGITSKAWAVVTATTRWGETPISSGANASFTGGQTVTVSWTPVVGAYSYNVYLGSGSSDPTSTGYWLQRPNGGSFTTSASTISFSGAVTTSGTAASTVTVSDTTAMSTGYDGMLSYLLGSSSGYVNHLNSTLSATNPGDEIQAVCSAIFDNVKGDPQEIVCAGADRKQLSDTLKSQGSSNYELMLMPPDQHSAQIGALVTGIQNEITGTMMSISMNPWWPQGTMGVLSWSVPIPNANVPEVWQLVGPQDYLGIEWPINQLTYDSSSFWMNSLVCYAPEFNGAVTGIVKS